MSFLVDTDFDVQARSELMQVLQISSISRDMAETMAEEEITGYLRPRGYDIPLIFSATGVNRNPLIIMRMIDMIIYHLHSNTPARAMPKLREDRYNAALLWLDKVNMGSLDPSLPKIAGTATDPIYRFGSGCKTFKRW